MKSKYWLMLLAGMLALCLGLSAWVLWPGEDAARAEIWSDGVLVRTVYLAEDGEYTVESRYGTNVITVKNGAIAVTSADCPDHYCMDRGYCRSGMQIVCLPNRLVIKFSGRQELDGISG